MASREENNDINSKAFGVFLAVVILFFYIFDFEIIKNVALSRSSLCAAGIAVIVVFLNKSKAAEISRKAFRLSNIKKACAYGALLFAFAWASFFMHATGDSSLAASITRSLLWILLTIVIYVSIKSLTDVSIFDLLIAAFVIQSLIIFFSLVSPEFKEATDVFRSDSVLSRGELYSGYRALGISGSAFFGLSICYGYIYLLVVYHWRNWRVRNPVIRLLAVSLLLLAGTSAGRTSQVGLIFAFLLACFIWVPSAKQRKIKPAHIVYVCLLAICLLLFLSVAGNIDLDGVFEYYLTYATSFFLNLNFSDILSSTSSTETLSKMYFELSPSQVLVGDGLYDINGAYYMGTDAGYMRTVLYFGILGFALMCITQFSILRVGGSWREKAFCLLAAIMLMVFQYKGEAILTPISLSSLIELAALEMSLFKCGTALRVGHEQYGQWKIRGSQEATCVDFR